MALTTVWVVRVEHADTREPVAQWVEQDQNRAENSADAFHRAGGGVGTL